jgi:hypothetical protein
LENGPWPSFVTVLKRLAQDDHDGASMVRDVLATLETSDVTKKGYWKGGTVGVISSTCALIRRGICFVVVRLIVIKYLTKHIVVFQAPCC